MDPTTYKGQYLKDVHSAESRIGATTTKPAPDLSPQSPLRGSLRGSTDEQTGFSTDSTVVVAVCASFGALWLCLGVGFAMICCFGKTTPTDGESWRMESPGAECTVNEVKSAYINAASPRDSVSTYASSLHTSPVGSTPQTTPTASPRHTWEAIPGCVPEGSLRSAVRKQSALGSPYVSPRPHAGMSIASSASSIRAGGAQSKGTLLTPEVQAYGLSPRGQPFQASVRASRHQRRSSEPAVQTYGLSPRDPQRSFGRRAPVKGSGSSSHSALRETARSR